MWELDYLEQCGNNSEDFQMVRDVLKFMFLIYYQKRNRYHHLKGTITLPEI